MTLRDADRKAVAKALRCSVQAVGDVLNGKTRAFTAANNAKAADFLRVSPKWLATGQGSATDEALQTQQVIHVEDATGRNGGGYTVLPLLSTAASMGPGEDQHDEVVVGRLTISPGWIEKRLKPFTAKENLKFIHGFGDSMSPTFEDGSILLVDGGVRTVDIDGIYVLEANQRVYIKRVRQRIDGAYEVSSDNPTVKTVDVLNGNSGHVNILGRVLWLWNGKKV